MILLLSGLAVLSAYFGYFVRFYSFIHWQVDEASIYIKAANQVNHTWIVWFWRDDSHWLFALWQFIWAVRSLGASIYEGNRAH